MRQLMLPMRNFLVPHGTQVARVARRPFFMVTASRTLPCSISWARNTCSVLLAKGLSSTSIPRATFQRMSKSARALASASLTLSWDWSRRAVASRLGGALSRPLSGQ